MLTRQIVAVTNSSIMLSAGERAIDVSLGRIGRLGAVAILASIMGLILLRS